MMFRIGGGRGARSAGAILRFATGVGNRYAVAQNRPMPGPRLDNEMLSDRQRRFLDDRRVGHLATADRGSVPHVVPVCYAVAEATVYITIDEKPKRRDVPLKRVRNLLENPRFSFIVDRWDEDWSRLGWIMLRGRAEILYAGHEHDRAQALLVARYPQYREMQLGDLPVIALRIARATGWGDL
jgi:PPOX class probable F420-dependent enzyme